MVRMQLPMSKSALDRLGSKLAASSRPSDGDLDQLADVVRAYQAVLDEVKQHLSDLGFSSTTRVKTQGTLLEKLKREQGMRLSRVQDLAGARIVVSDRLEQDEARDRICSHFTAMGHACRVRDRREEPSHGYRAVHVIVQYDGIPVEVQIRTGPQDSWAQIVERLGDRWGRALRYGGEPEVPDAEVQIGELTTTRRDLLRTVIETSDYIDLFESAQKLLREVEEDDANLRKIPEADLIKLKDGTVERVMLVRQRLDEAKRTLSEMDDRVRRILRELATVTEEADD